MVSRYLVSGCSFALSLVISLTFASPRVEAETTGMVVLPAGPGQSNPPNSSDPAPPGGGACNPDGQICQSHCDPLINSDGSQMVDSSGALVCNPATYVCDVVPECAGLGYGCVCVFYPDPPTGSSSSESSISSSSSVSSESSSSSTSQSQSSSFSSSLSSSSMSSSEISSSASSEQSSSLSSSSAQSSSVAASSESSSSSVSESSASSEQSNISESSSSSSSAPSASSDSSQGSAGNSESAASSSAVPSCLSQSIEEKQLALGLGPKELKTYALRAHKKLIRSAAKTNKTLGKRLALSAKKSEKKMDKYILEATVALNALPKVVLICPLDEPGCTSIDHSALIEQHRRAVIKLRQLVIRMLNRATRLVYGGTVKARKATSAHGKGARRISKGLVADADALPKYHSECPQFQM